MVFFSRPYPTELFVYHLKRISNEGVTLIYCPTCYFVDFICPDRRIARG